MKYKVVDLNNKQVEEVEINDSIFRTQVFPDIINNYLRYQASKKRKGNHKTKNRSEVRGKAKKPFSQKGTGNARQGSSKGPHFRGGGVAFGPVVRSHAINLNKKERKIALRCAFSEKLKNNEIIILNDIKLNTHKTKNFNKQINSFNFKSAIFIQNKKEIDKNFILASSNIPKINYLTTDALNVRDIIKYEKVVILKNALSDIEKRLLWEIL